MALPSAVAPIAVKSATGVLTATGVWGMLLTLASILIVGVVAYIRIVPRLRELENANNAGLRKEFIDEMTELRKEVKGLRDENTLLRREIHELHGVIDGMRRENQAAQISGQRAIRHHLESLPQSGASK